MSLALATQHLFSAITVSAFYALMAVSYVLMHAISRRINLAFGALAIWCGYIVVDVTLGAMLRMPGRMLVPLAIGLAVGLLHTTITGHLTERWVIRHLVAGRSFAMIIATLGLALVLAEIIRITHQGRAVWLMPVFADTLTLWTDGGFAVTVTVVQLATVAIALALAGALALLLSRHRFGRDWRAVSQDAEMAELCGVNTIRVFTLTFILATAYAAAGGALLVLNYGSADFQGGLVMGLKTLFVAVIGGLDQPAGAFAGAFCLGLLETFWSATMGAEYRDVAAFALLTGLLILFPGGLFAGPSRIDHVR